MRMSAETYRTLPKPDRIEIGFQAIDHALAAAGYADRGPAPGLHGGAHIRLYEKDGQTYRIVRKISRGSWIGFQPKFDRTGRLLEVRSLDEVDKVAVSTVDYRRDQLRVFLFDQPDVRACFTAQFNKRREIGKLPRGGIGMWFNLATHHDVDGRPLNEREAAGSGLAERYSPIAEFPIEAPSDAETPAPAPASGSGDLLIGDRQQLMPHPILIAIYDDRLYGGSPAEIAAQLYADAPMTHDTERTVEAWMSAVFGRMGIDAPVLSPEFFLGALVAAGQIELFPPGSKIWPRPFDKKVA